MSLHAMEALEHRPRPLATLVSGADAVTVIGVLPQNSTEYAAAASEAGADAIMVGIDKSDASLPGLFGSFDLMEESIDAILSTTSVPVGISIGDSRPLIIENWERIVSKPFSFVNMFAHHMPPFVLEDDRIEKLVSIGPGYMLEQVKGISEMASVTALEAAITAPQGRSHIFSALDLATLRVLAGLCSKPIIVRTQKRMSSDDLNSAIAAGLKGVSVDAAVLEPGIEAYRDAIENYVKHNHSKTLGPV
ncbi:MAG: hypothetical protein OK455_09500 [Thaumarchaeota archaeon]|nr:hypothetical protein [Nitrososphaerota archaeon]